MPAQTPISIVEYTDQYHADLVRLTLEWLEKYVAVEPEDRLFMDDPQGHVIQRGGYIFMAVMDGEAVGTVSLCKVADGEYELAKLAVSEQYQGLKIGSRLMEVAMEKARAVQAKKIILYTAKILAVAHQMYIRLGFQEVHGENLKYDGADTKMVLVL